MVWRIDLDTSEAAASDVPGIPNPPWAEACAAAIWASLRGNRGGREGGRPSMEAETLVWARLRLDRLSPFAARISRLLAARVPRGQVVTYGELAAWGGCCARAVGGVMAANPFPLAIACHRVVASNGYGGFGYGLEMKKRLLREEGVFWDLALAKSANRR